MNELVIDKKKYVLIPRREYDLLMKRAAQKFKPEKVLSLDEARAYSNV